MRRVNLGCGPNILAGWENYDAEVDLRRRLPFANDEIDAIFAEHVVEHITPREAFSFFEECCRILRPGGALRITVPSVVKMLRNMTDEYRAQVQKKGWADGSTKSTFRAMLCEHGHQGAWDSDLLKAFLEGAGFREAQEAELYKSRFPFFNGVEGHHRLVGEYMNSLESISVEAVK